jgi:hypothetical protein
MKSASVEGLYDSVCDRVADHADRLLSYGRGAIWGIRGGGQPAL